LAAEPPRCIDHLLDTASELLDESVFPVFDPLGRRLVVPGRRGETLTVFDALRLERLAELPGGGRYHNLFALAPNGRFLAVHERSMPQWWEAKLVGWVGRPLPWKRDDCDACSVHFYDLETGASRGRVPAGQVPSFDPPVICGDDSRAGWDTDTLIGFGPDGRSLWVYRQDWDQRSRPSPFHVRCWAVPSPWPPAWLLGVTALGGLLAVADGWSARRRGRPAGRKAPRLVEFGDGRDGGAVRYSQQPRAVT
jgi:hypothetical protein